MIYAYIRQPKFDKPTEQLTGITVDRVYEDHVQLAEKEWPELNAMLDALKPGDIIYVQSLDRICSKIKHLPALISRISKAKATLIARDENVELGASTTTAGPFMAALTMLANLDATLDKARASEVKVGRKPKLTEAQVEEIKLRVGRGEKVAALARQYGVSRESLYRHYGVKAAD